mgnify:FL=1
MRLFSTLLLVSFVLLLPNAYASSSTVQLNGKTFDITYEATGLTIDTIEADTSSATITVSLTAVDSPGTLQITLDRSFFDSRTSNSDDQFLVLADGAEAQFTEIKTDASRTLTITVPAGTNNVDIISQGDTNFGSGEPKQSTTEESASSKPEESTPLLTAPAPTETIPNNATAPEPTVQCGQGTVLKDGVCVLETPVTATPEPEPVVTEPSVTTSQTSTPTPESTKQCGPGTTLKDDLCVLDQSCGTGTILKDGQCVLETSTMPEGQGQQFLFGIIAAFIIAVVIMIVLWGIGKAGKTKN